MLKRKHAAACALLMAAAAAAAMINSLQACAAGTEGYADAVVSLVNAERAAAGLEPVYAVPSLNHAAAVRAAETVTNFSHTRPDGRSCSTVLTDAGIPWRMTGENIAYGYTTPEMVMDGWMHSEGHRANILGDFDYIGVGVTEQNGTLYWTQVFTGGEVLEGAYLPGEAAAPSVPETKPELPTEPITSEVPVAPECSGGNCGEAFTVCVGESCPLFTCGSGDCADPLRTLLQGCLNGKGCGAGMLLGMMGCGK